MDGLMREQSLTIYAGDFIEICYWISSPIDYNKRSSSAFGINISL
jgi:hypothetical protein